MEHDAQNIYRTITNGEEQTLNKEMIDFGISIIFQYFMYILAKFNTFTMS